MDRRADATRRRAGGETGGAEEEGSEEGGEVVVTAQQIEQKFLTHTLQAPSGCLIWMGSTNDDGYGCLSWPDGYTWQYAHRVSHEVFLGPIPDGLQVDHLGRHRRCVLPMHLQAVTPRINTLRGMGITALQAARTHCPQDHPYDDENTYVHNGKRACKQCRRER